MHPAGIKIFLLILLAANCHISLLAQNRYLDSLQNAVKQKGLPDSVRLELLIEIGNAVSKNDPAMAREKYRNVYSIAEKNRDHYYMGMAMSGLGKLYDSGQDDSMMYYYLFADSLFQLDPSQKSKESRVTNKASIAELLSSKSQYDAAIQTYLEAIPIMEKSNASNKWLVLGVLHSNIASVYHNLKQKSKALEYDLKALEAYSKKSVDPLYVVTGELYVAGDYKDLNQIENAKKHIRNAQKVAEEIKSADLFYRVYSSWGGLYQKSKEYGKAVISYEKALAYAIENKNRQQEQ